jgi:diguanylate cyclase (GGDEF)-like protein/PAS domain S-box-containing protein
MGESRHRIGNYRGCGGSDTVGYQYNSNHRYGGRGGSGGSIRVSRHAHEAGEKPVRPAGSAALLIGLVLATFAAGTCAALPVVVEGARPVRLPLWGCAAALVLATGLLARSRERLLRQLVAVHDEGRRTSAEKQAMAEALRRERDFTETVLDTAGALVMVCDRTGRIVRFNDACERLTGYLEGDMVGRHVWQVLEPADGRIMQAAMEALDGGRLRVRADVSQRTEITWRDQAGDRHRIAFTITVLLDPAGEVDYFVATGVDVTEQRRNHEQLVQLATTDALTGLVNRTTFRDTLKFALDRTTGHGAALLFCDLDGFKKVNDSLGHAAGDELLVAVSKRLKRTVRQHDVVARLGGDEFVVLCPALDEIAAHRLAERIRKAVAAPYGLTTGGATIGVSVGVAVADAGASPEMVLAEADGEMYRAKQRMKSGRWVPPPMRAPG